MATQYDWTAEQVCGECGKGVFVERAYGAACTRCDHVHPMDPWNLDEGEHFEWRRVYAVPTLHVTAYPVAHGA